jgi:hypothetical protein
MKYSVLSTVTGEDITVEIFSKEFLGDTDGNFETTPILKSQDLKGVKQEKRGFNHHWYHFKKKGEVPFLRITAGAEIHEISF